MTVRVCPICDIADCATHRPTTTLDLADRIEQLEAKLAKAAAYLQKISRHANRSCSAIAARALAELEGEPLGAEFEAVWDANKEELYEP